MTRTMKVALYGYGYFGRRTSESFRYYWGDEYEVTAIFDTRYAGETDRFWNLTVLSPESVFSEYDKGVFEAAMICINDFGQRENVTSCLKKRGIPLFLPGREADFAKPSDFSEVAEPGLTIRREHYRFHVYRDMLGAVANFDKRVFLFLFNEDGRLNVDSYRKYPGYYTPYQLMYPFRLKDPVPERVYMKGDWCPIVKAYSVNFGHFMFETADCVYLMEKAGYKGKYLYNRTSFADQLLRILGVSEDRLVSMEKLDVHKVYVFERLYDINHDDLGEMKYSTDVLSEMSRFFKAKLTRDDRYPKKLYVKRIGIRKLLDGEEIAVKNGFSVMAPEEHTVIEQMEYFYNADIVLTAHGANSANCLCMREGTVFIETFSDRWDLNMNAPVCEACGVNYLKLTGKALGTSARFDNVADYHVDEEALQMKIRKAERLVGYLPGPADNKGTERNV